MREGKEREMTKRERAEKIADVVDNVLSNHAYHFKIDIQESRAGCRLTFTWMEFRFVYEISNWDFHKRTDEYLVGDLIFRFNAILCDKKFRTGFIKRLARAPEQEQEE